jgi:hypothetical protein
MRLRNRPSAALSLLVFSAFAFAPLVLAGCPNKDKAQDQQGAPPPPPPPAATAKAGACATGGGEIADPITAPFFPRTVTGSGGATYCVDPQGDTRTYGEKGKLTMDEVCTTAVDGECEVYKKFGLKRFVAFRYVDGGGAGGSVEVYLSQFADANGGYGMFTKRVIADGDPADPSAPKPLAAGGAAAMGTGRGYVWKGAYLAELQYINENESPEQIAKTSEPVLAAMAKEIGAKLPGTSDKPASAKALPEAGLVNANAIQFYPKEPLGFTNVGAGAVGFYKDGARRYRLVAIQRDDVEQAKDAMKTIKSKAGALPIAGLFDEAVHVVVQPAPEAAKAEYVIVRKGSLIAAAGDEDLLIKPGDSPDKQAAARLTKDEAIAKLKLWLTSPPPPDAGKK